MFLGLDNVPNQSNRLGELSAVADGWAVGAGGNCSLGCIGFFERVGPGEWVLRQQVAPSWGFPPEMIAMSPGRMIVSTFAGIFDGVTNAGRAEIFELDPDGVWRRAALLAPAELVTNSRFGHSVAIDGDRAIVLAKAAFTGSEHVKAFIFERSAAGVWSLAQSIPLVDFQGQDRPSHVAIAGDSLAVLYADFSKGNLSLASVRWYERGAGGWAFNGEQQITAANFGLPWIGMAENVTVLSFGGEGIDGVGDGGLIVYRRGSDGEWTRTQAIENLLSEPFSFSQSFGFDGTTIAVGVNSFPTLENTVLLFRAGAEGVFTFEQAVTSAFFPPGDNTGFAASIGVDGRDLVVGVSAARASSVVPDLDRGQLAFFDRTADVDTDGDGLLDDWELNGIPFVRVDGTTGRVVLSQADPLRKDIYIEVDVGVSGPPQASYDAVIAAFAASPVSNPDGSSGITLHILADEFEIVPPNPTVAFGGLPLDFEQIMSERFGTESERADPDAAALLDAKRTAFRYCFAYPSINFTGGARRYVGRAFGINGPAFVLNMSGPLFNDGRHDDLDIAATFMHELGHSLGLRHGVCDDTLGKPNYPSIMNYTMGHPLRWNERFWRLDYSREELGGLNETALDESAGIDSQLYRRTFLPYGVGPDIARSYRLVKLAGRPTDFNGNGIRAGIVEADLNFLGTNAGVPTLNEPSPGEPMPGWNDWQNLTYTIGVGTDRGATEGTDGCPDDLTVALLEALAVAPCEVDINDDGLVNFFDLHDYLLAYNAEDLEADFADPFDVLNFSDISAFIAAFSAGCP